MSKIYRVHIEYYWPHWWGNFLHHCDDIMKVSDWGILTVINRQLKPHGKFIQTTGQGAFLVWDDEKYHTLFVLKWS